MHLLLPDRCEIQRGAYEDVGVRVLLNRLKGQSWYKEIITGFTFLGLFMIVTELVCYLIIFKHISHHNNQVMSGMLDPKVIAMRNHVNAVTLKGKGSKAQFV